MAIQPPSDIVLDVLKAADPASVEMAQAKLKAGQAASEAQRLSGTDRGFDVTLGRHQASRTTEHLTEKKTVPETYRKFEGMVLQSMIKSMLPDSQEIYGKGAAGEIWKGMLAEHLGNAIAKDGGVGIAEHLAKNGPTAVEDARESRDKARGERLHVRTQLIERNQLEALDALLPGDQKQKRTDRV
ncbi:MAG: hypothetical protein RLZZ444_2716 [Pseudomonadota bacterium]